MHSSIFPDDSILILGIGNLLWADQGFGVRCPEAWDLAVVLPKVLKLFGSRLRAGVAGPGAGRLASA